MCPVVASNHLRTGGLIRTHHVPVLFGVELGRRVFVESTRVTEHHGELPPFGRQGVAGPPGEAPDLSPEHYPITSVSWWERPMRQRVDNKKGSR